MPSMLVTVNISKGFKTWTEMAKKMQEEVQTCREFPHPESRGEGRKRVEGMKADYPKLNHFSLEGWWDFMVVCASEASRCSTAPDQTIH